MRSKRRLQSAFAAAGHAEVGLAAPPQAQAWLAHTCTAALRQVTLRVWGVAVRDTTGVNTRGSADWNLSARNCMCVASFRTTTQIRRAAGWSPNSFAPARALLPLPFPVDGAALPGVWERPCRSSSQHFAWNIRSESFSIFCQELLVFVSTLARPCTGGAKGTLAGAPNTVQRLRLLYPRVCGSHAQSRGARRA